VGRGGGGESEGDGQHTQAYPSMVSQPPSTTYFVACLYPRLTQLGTSLRRVGAGWCLVSVHA
jgi:hypothetical protein